MPLTLHLSPRADLLVDELAALLATPLQDPFAHELVVVPGKGLERWVAQRLAHRLGTRDGRSDGVSAGIKFLTPHRFSSLLTGRERDDAWQPDRLVWPLLTTIDEVLGSPGFEVLSEHLGHGGTRPGDDLRRGRRYSVALRLADLFSSYADQRPGLLCDWRAAIDSDGAGQQLPADLRWQAELLRRLTARVQETPPDIRLAETAKRLAEGTHAGLPPRVSWFGRSRPNSTEVALLTAVAEHHDVHVWLPEPSPQAWQTLAPLTERGVVPRSDDLSARTLQHPLLGALGRESRELRALLGQVHTVAVSAPQTPSTLLGWLQDDLRLDRAPRPAGRVLAGGDRSVQIHSCHGPARQVDVLREVLVGLMEDDPTLEPRDVLVLCPDLDTYSPLFSAAFGLAEVAEGAHPGHDLRVRLANHSPSSANPLLAFALTMLELSTSRVSATQVLDVAASAPVRARFSFSDEDLDRLTRWVHDAGIRWGLDHGHRASYGVPIVHNSWLIGMRRVLLGAAVSGLDDRIVQATLALDDVGDGDLDLLGRFTEFLDRLTAFVEQAAGARTVAHWTTALSEVVAGLTLTSRDEAWQRAQFDREMLAVASAPGAAETPLRTADITALVARRLRGRASRSTFRTGALTVTTLAPLRSVPHRVVALVGLDDGVFPRRRRTDGDDVLARRPLVGEHDPGSEDRQLLLDAVSSAAEHLVITHSGRGEHTGQEKPPAVPLGELLDALEATASTGDGTTIRDHVVVEHPLQPFDEKNLRPGALGGPSAFTFDRQALAGALAARAPRQQDNSLLASPLPPRAAATPRDRVGDGASDVEDERDADQLVVNLSDLHDFFRHPVKAFLTQRLRVTLPREQEGADDGIPIELGGLEKWAVGEHLLRARLRGVPAGDAGFVERLRGGLPPNQLGITLMNEIGRTVDTLVAGVEQLPSGRARTVDVDVDLGDVRVVGTVPEVFGNHRMTVTYSALAAKHRIAGWIDAVALGAGHPDENWTIHSIGRKGNGGTESCIAPLPENEARAWLRRLVRIREQGLREPLPLPLKTSLRWAEEHALQRSGRDVDPDVRAEGEWVTPAFGYKPFPREDADAAHVLVWGRSTPFSRLTAPVRPDEAGVRDLPPGVGVHRLGHYAWALWGPLLTDDIERVKPL